LFVSVFSVQSAKRQREERKDLNKNNLEGVEEIFFERSGKLSVIKEPGAD